ncbi:MAG: DMT family transporter [Acidimicrobiia bacterium]|nr:DMT family transporter [Acidimicrobiia bacterium]
MHPTAILLVALVGGVAIALQAQFAGVLDSRMGALDALFISFASAGVVIAVIRVARGGIDPGVWRGAPWWAYLVGVFALLIVGAIGFSTARAGLVPTLATVTVAQFATGAAVAHFGWFGTPADPVDLETITGLVLLCVGGWLVIR